MRFLELLLLLAPAYLGNMAPPLLRYRRGWNPPIDAPLLGSHKTLYGFIAGVATAVLVAVLEARLLPASLRFPGQAHGFPMGLALGLGAMCGDCAKSALKRSRRMPPGARWIPFDQLDFIAGALLFVAPVVELRWPEVAAVLVFTFVADLAVNRLAHRLGIKETPW